MTDDLRARAIALHDRFTHGAQSRRAFMRELTALAGGVAAAEAMLAGIAASPAAAAIVAPDDARLTTATVRWKAAGGRMLSGYRAAPKGAAARPAVIVIHENRGLNEHIRDIARRIALAGFVAVAPDFLSSAGGTPADEDRARQMIGALDLAATTADAVATARWLGAEKGVGGRVGAIGFCWGGALVDRLAVAAGPTLTAGVSFYGPAPDPVEAKRVKAAMLLHYAGLDERVNATGLPWAEALKAAGAKVEAHVYPNVNHAFNNDTSAGRYDAAAAALAWGRTIAFLRAELDATGARR